MMKTKLHYSLYIICGLSFLMIASHYAQAKELNTDSLVVQKGYNRELSSFGESIEHFILVDADNNTEIASITEGKILNSILIKDTNLNIKVNTIGETDFISVKFSLSGPISRVWTEMKAPYALFGDINGNYNGVALPAGKYHLTASAIHELGGHLNTIEVSFIVPDPNGIIGLDMIFLEENRVFSTGGLSDGRVFNSTNDPFLKNPKTIIAQVDDGFTGSIKMEIEGPPFWEGSSRIENIVPYSMFGDGSHLPLEDAHRDFNFRNFPDGTYRITATPYEKANGSGSAGTAMIITIVIEDNSSQIVFEYQSDTTVYSPFSFVEIEDGHTYYPTSGEFTSETAIVASIANAPPGVNFIFNLSGPINHTQLENKPPYSLFGDINGNFNRMIFPDGEYTLTATPYTESDGEGISGVPQTVSFTIDLPDTWQTSVIWLVDANNPFEIAIDDLFDDSDDNVIDIAKTPTENVSILVDYECDFDYGCPESLSMVLEGPVTFSRIENVSPFTLFGDIDRDLNGMNLPIGNYTITVTPFWEENALGEPAGPTVTRDFQIVDSNSALLSKAVLYPNPATNTTFIKSNNNNLNTKTTVFDMTGNKINEWSTLGSYDKAIDLSDLHSGIYIIQIQTEKGIETKKLVVQ